MTSRPFSQRSYKHHAMASDGVRDQGLASSTSAHSSNPIWRLQHTIGNQAVQQLLRSGRDTLVRTECSSNDALEQDADRISRQIMNGQGLAPAQPVPMPGLVQMKSAKSAETPAADVLPVVHAALRSTDQPLDSATRAFMEPRFGLDFSHVRVYTDSQAAESAKAIDANAYTLGHHIVFAPGKFAPSTPSGQSLLAHELAHVAQQSNSGPALQRQATGQEMDQDELLKIAEDTVKSVAELQQKAEQGKADMRKFQEGFQKAAEEQEIARWGDALAKKGKSRPTSSTRVSTQNTAFFVEALIKTSQSLRPYLHDRLIVKVAPNFVIDKTRQDFETADKEGTNEVTPFSAAHQSTQTYGFYNRVRRTKHLVPDSIHLSPDAKFSDALHEGVHKFSKFAFESVFGKYLNEGVTQIFADLAWGDAQLEGTPRNAYGDELDCARILVSWLGGGAKARDLLGNAYFQGHTDPVSAEVMRRLGVAALELSKLSREKRGLGLCQSMKMI